MQKAYMTTFIGRSLKPGNYLLYKASTAQQTSILQSVPQEISDYDLYDAYGVDST